MNQLMRKKSVVFVAILLLTITTLYIITLTESKIDNFDAEKDVEAAKSGSDAAKDLIPVAVNDVDTTYKAYILGTMTLTINEQDNEYQTGDTIDLKSGDNIFFKAGKGYVTIEGGERIITLSAKNNKKIQLLGIKDKVESKKITQVFPESTKGDNTIRGSSKGAAYTNSMSLDGVSPLNIESGSWILSQSRLPIVLQLINQNGTIEEIFESKRQDIVSFTIPKSVYCGKNGYTLKISNQQGQVMVNSKLIIPACKCQCGIIGI